MGIIADFTEQYQKKNTRKIYSTGIKAFLAYLYPVDPEDGTKFSIDRKNNTPNEIYESAAKRYLSEGRDYSQDVINFAGSFGNSPPKTARTYLAAVKEFLIFCDVELKESDLRKIRRRTPTGGAATIEKILDAATVKAILFHCSLMMRAIILLLVSSGMRIGEVLVLDMADIDVSKENEIGVIGIRGLIANGNGAKGGYQRYAFCSVESAEAIRAWLKKRDAYLRESVNKGKGIGQVKNINDTRLFPVSSSTVGDAWLIALQAAQLVSRDSVTNRLQIHIHMTRKFFSSQMRLAVPTDIVEGLMGHSGYLSDSYRRYTRKQVEDFYRKGEPYVTIQITEVIRELRTNTDKKMQAHSEILEGLIQKSMNQERTLKEQQNMIDALQKVIQ
jgi:integrase